DDDADGAQVGNTQKLSGKTGGTAKWTATVPDGYKLADNQADHGTVTFTTDTDGVTIHLTHVIDNGTITTKRTIHYVYVGGSQAASDKPQTVTYDTATDEVTNVTTYTPQGGFDEVTSPLIAGYTANPSTAPAVALTAGTVKPTNPQDVTVTYTGNDQTA
ncbi:mucin-binding protein, partial [Lacticaseibacillus nasuensis]|uniref:mucin-binding protein n=1 Tax=Lacticaseibacillus nasuensis TaxID=944671 RepID=UPI00177E6821